MEKRSVHERWDEIRKEVQDRMKEKSGDGKDALDCGDEIDACLTKLTGLLCLMEVCREGARDAIDWNAVARVMGDYVEHIKELADRSWELYIGCRDLAEDLLAQIKGEASPDPVRARRNAQSAEDQKVSRVADEFLREHKEASPTAGKQTEEAPKEQDS